MRLALGATPRRVADQLIRESLLNTVGSVLLGGVLAIAAGRFVGSLLVGVSSEDPRTLGVVAATLIAVSILAALGPAIRAGHVDPVKAPGGLRSASRNA